MTVLIGLVLAYARRLVPGAFVRAAVRAAGLGYALPGTVLALGLLIPLAAFDNGVDASGARACSASPPACCCRAACS